MLILASASLRRKELLTQIGLTFDVQTAEIDETQQLGEEVRAYTMRLAEHKAAAVLARQRDASRMTVIGADTAVFCEGRILGKPVNEADAARMLRLLSGKTHEVVTGVAVLTASAKKVEAEVTRVWVAELTEAQIAGYIASGEPMGKAGAYAIQGRAARFVPRVEGCYFNVVGLPLARVSAMLEGIR